MDIHEALRQAQLETGWSRTRIAVEAGVTEASARSWLLGRAVPSGDKLEMLRAKMPALRRILDAQAASIRIDEIEFPRAA